MVPMRLVNLREKGFGGGQGRGGRLKLVHREVEIVEVYGGNLVAFATGNAGEGTWILCIHIYIHYSAFVTAIYISALFGGLRI
jgi:hypothetical protein